MGMHLSILPLSRGNQKLALRKHGRWSLGAGVCILMLPLFCSLTMGKLHNIFASASSLNVGITLVPTSRDYL